MEYECKKNCAHFEKKLLNLKHLLFLFDQILIHSLKYLRSSVSGCNDILGLEHLY